MEGRLRGGGYVFAEGVYRFCTSALDGDWLGLMVCSLERVKQALVSGLRTRKSRSTPGTQAGKAAPSHVTGRGTVEATLVDVEDGDSSIALALSMSEGLVDDADIEEGEGQE